MTDKEIEAARILSAALKDFINAVETDRPCDPERQAEYMRRMQALEAQGGKRKST